MKPHKGVIENIVGPGSNISGKAMISVKNGGNMAVLTMVTLPKDKGGLGVINLRAQHDALLRKHGCV